MGKTFDNADRGIISDGVIGEHCASHTAEEWLTILRQKSIEQGKALSWYQIKQDPSLNHIEIRQKLGLYVKYEDDLRRCVESGDASTAQMKSIASAPVIRLVPPKTPAETAPVAPPKKRGRRPKGEALAHLEVPQTGPMAHAGNMLILARLTDDREEMLLKHSEVAVTTWPTWFDPATITRVLSGHSSTTRVVAATILPGQIELKMGHYASEGDEVPDKQGRCVITLQPYKATDYLLSLYLLMAENENGNYYVMFRRGTSQQSTKILDAASYSEQ